jgi:peptide/nickel transport system ATP-binding protein
MSTAGSDRREPLLAVEDLGVEYRPGRGRPPVRALIDADLRVYPGETVGVVGESGSGKTTLGRAILGLAPVSTGSIFFEGAEITQAGRRVRSRLSRQLQVVFQDPYGSLNPTRTIGQTLAESLRVARALMVEPGLVICDEVVSALDLSVQAQVLNLLRELQDEMHLSYVFIGHDLDVVRYLSERAVVLSRCPHAVALCREQIPELEQTDKATLAACHRWNELDLSGAGDERRPQNGGERV